MKQLSYLSFILLLVAGFIACQKEDYTTDSKHLSKRVHFDNFQAFSSTMDNLAAMHTREKMNEWSKNQGYTNLLFTEDEDLQQLPFVFRTILNDQAEFEYKDSIIWYHDGTLYGFAKSDEPNLVVLKKTPEKCHVVGFSKTQRKEEAADRNTCMAINGRDSRYQRQFNQQNYAPCGGISTGNTGIRKYVHELYGFVTTIEAQYKSYLMLRIKLEYRTSTGKWKPAGEQRAINVNVTGIIGTLDDCNEVGGSEAYTINENDVCVNDTEYSLGFGVVTDTYPNKWNFTMTGSITHSIMGDAPANTWINSGQLW